MSISPLPPASPMSGPPCADDAPPDSAAAFLRLDPALLTSPALRQAIERLREHVAVIERSGAR